MKSYRWVPFVPVGPDSSMLSVMLLLSKYRLRNVPVIEQGRSSIDNFITQSAIVQGLQRCKGRDWFDCIAANPISDLGLPFMDPNQVKQDYCMSQHNCSLEKMHNSLVLLILAEYCWLSAR